MLMRRVSHKSNAKGWKLMSKQQAKQQNIIEQQPVEEGKVEIFYPPSASMDNLGQGVSASGMHATFLRSKNWRSHGEVFAKQRELDAKAAQEADETRQRHEQQQAAARALAKAEADRLEAERRKALEKPAPTAEELRQDLIVRAFLAEKGPLDDRLRWIHTRVRSLAEALHPAHYPVWSAQQTAIAQELIDLHHEEQSIHRKSAELEAKTAMELHQ
jgi:hypothetical protein